MLIAFTSDHPLRLSNDIIFSITPHPMTELETLKTLLSDAETDYQHCIARGDWEQCSAAKSKVARLRNRIGKIIKQRMALA
ncbi:MAG: hypothetical protein VXX91_07820 [Planctomycetota bacterium]|nr:hypothetical protein [Planctomycetota bacterium]